MAGKSCGGMDQKSSQTFSPSLVISKEKQTESSLVVTFQFGKTKLVLFLLVVYATLWFEYLIIFQLNWTEQIQVS